MASASLDGARLKINRAKLHLGNLGRAVKRFRETSAYEIATADNPDTGLREWRVVQADPLPPSLSLLTGDVVHNLRSALDHLVYQLVLANGNSPDTRTGFPMWKTRSSFEQNRPGSAEGLSTQALSILYGLKPYKSGNPHLWILHRLDIIDKHRLVLAVAEAHRNTIIDLGPTLEAQGAFGIPPPPVTVVPDQPQPIEAGTVLLRWAPIDDVDFTFGTALDEPGLVTCEPLLPTLEDLAAAVDATVALFAPLF